MGRVTRLEEQQLIDVQMSVLKTYGGSRQGQKPGPIHGVIHLAQTMRHIFLQTARPGAASERIMRPQILDVDYLEPGAFGKPDDVAEMREFSTGKDLATHKERFRTIVHVFGSRNSVVENQATGSNKPVQRLEISFQPSPADVFEHADGGDFVKRSFHITVVAQLDAHLSAESTFHHLST